jgi:hypothetical protein
MSERNLLIDLYINKKKSAAQIGFILNIKERKVHLLLKKYKIQKRTISEAIYVLKNPEGDPFLFKKPKNTQEYFLFGLGLGLYWGEGLKVGKNGLRLTNSDPKMIIKFIEFLESVFSVNKANLRFSLQVFEDISIEESLGYWSNILNVEARQFYKTIVSKVRGEGSYKNKSKHGIVILYLNNIKIKKLILEMIENIQ